MEAHDPFEGVSFNLLLLEYFSSRPWKGAQPSVVQLYQDYLTLRGADS